MGLPVSVEHATSFLEGAECLCHLVFCRLNLVGHVMAASHLEENVRGVG